MTWVTKSVEVDVNHQDVRNSIPDFNPLELVDIFHCIDEATTDDVLGELVAFSTSAFQRFARDVAKYSLRVRIAAEDAADKASEKEVL